MPSSQSTPFVPKQLVPYGPDVLSELCNKATANIAAAFLPEVTKQHQESPKFSSWVVHDNACGYGEVTRTLLELPPPKSVKEIVLVGTDNNEAMIERFMKLKSHPGLENSYSLSGEVQGAEAQKFPDQHFTHSFTNFLINSGPHPDQNGAIVREIYRTLRPGGIAVLTNWAKVSFSAAVMATHERTRGKDAPPLIMGMAEELQKPEFTISLMESAGFDRSKMTILSKTTPACALWSDKAARTRYVGLMWSILGATTSGWTQQDEERWDEALQILAEEMSRIDEIELNKEILELPLTATIVIAQK